MKLKVHYTLYLHGLGFLNVLIAFWVGVFLQVKIDWISLHHFSTMLCTCLNKISCFRYVHVYWTLYKPILSRALCESLGLQTPKSRIDTKKSKARRGDRKDIFGFSFSQKLFEGY